MQSKRLIEKRHHRQLVVLHVADIRLHSVSNVRRLRAEIVNVQLLAELKYDIPQACIQLLDFHLHPVNKVKFALDLRQVVLELILRRDSHGKLLF